MQCYRYYILDDQAHVRWAESIDAAALNEVLEKAQAMLKEWPHSQSVEIWQGVKKVYPPGPVSG